MALESPESVRRTAEMITHPARPQSRLEKSLGYVRLIHLVHGQDWHCWSISLLMGCVNWASAYAKLIWTALNPLYQHVRLQSRTPRAQGDVLLLAPSPEHLTSRQDIVDEAYIYTQEAGKRQQKKVEEQGANWRRFTSTCEVEARLSRLGSIGLVLFTPCLSWPYRDGRKKRHSTSMSKSK